MISPPLVSVIIPSYNREDLIAETLQSVMDQTYSSWECIVVDDGSTDDTKGIIQQFVEKDKRFIFLNRHREPKGAPTCRNIGIEKCNGKYVMFLDSDDQLTKFCLQERTHTALKNKHYDAWVFKTNVVDVAKKRTTELTYNSPLPILYGFICHCFPLPWHTMSPLWKVDTLKKLNGFNENYPRFQDPELHTRALLNNVNFYHSQKAPDTFYFLHKTKPTQVDILNSQKRALEGLRLYALDVTTLVAQRSDSKHIQSLLTKSLIRFMRKYFNTLHEHKNSLQATILILDQNNFIRALVLNSILSLSQYYWLPGIYRLNKFLLFRVLSHKPCC